MQQFVANLKKKAELLRIMPDLSLRITFSAISIMLIVSAFLLGELHGRSVRAEEQLAVVGALPYVDYGEYGAKVRPLKQDAAVVNTQMRLYVASQNGKTYYPVGCKSAARIKEENRIYFGSVAEASASGLTPAKNCTF